MKAMTKAMIWMITMIAIAVATMAMSPSLKSAVFPPVDDSDRITEAFQNRISNIFVETEATVLWVYPEIDEDRHYQQFTVALANGHRVLVQHSLDEARRVPLKKHMTIRLRGEYDWTSTGGLLHWTHDDPDGRRESGWIEIDGQRYF